jgi:hypothetical protein
VPREHRRTTGREGDAVERRTKVSRVSVGLSAALASAYLREESGTPAVDAVRELVAAQDSELVPQAALPRPDELDPSSTDIVWFTCDVDDPAAPDLARRLLDVDGVRSAFVGAPEGPP